LIKVRKLALNLPDLYERPTTPATVTALASSPSAGLRAVGMMRVTEAGAIDSYALAPLSRLGYGAAFTQ